MHSKLAGIELAGKNGKKLLLLMTCALFFHFQLQQSIALKELSMTLVQLHVLKLVEIRLQDTAVT